MGSLFIDTQIIFMYNEYVRERNYMKQTIAYQLARSMMDEHGLTHWSFGFDTATRRLGVCIIGRQRIQLSRTFTRLNPEDKVKQVILHEIAHALSPRNAHHGEQWKKTAIAIGCIDPRPYTSAISPPPKFISYCPNGHIGFTEKRRLRYVPSCGRCDKRYNPLFTLQYKRNPEYTEAMNG